ncbi:MAG: outer membrane protein transport protein [Myxococcota bacterium]|nr:outer membrane protein transport protein [Deltaproteobacteria bacterium]MDQ3334943.1 outer membrane protein transport protein [Myxococcota bacterium]
MLPGSGAISTSRAGAAVASVDDGEALSINPAGLAKTTGTTITISAAIIGYSMSFHRAGNHDAIMDEDRPYEGQRYESISNNPDLPLGIGKYQPVPMVAVVSDLGGRVKGLRLALGLYAPNAYPFRDMTDGYDFNGDFNEAPPAARYDIMKQKAAVLFPSIGASYSILPELDVGARFSFGFADIESTVAVWGSPGNYVEAVTHDAALTIEGSDSFVPTWAIGAMYRPTPNLEFGANFNWRAVIRAKGHVTSVQGPNVQFNMQPTSIGPAADDFARCEPNPSASNAGNFERQNACVDFQIPMNAQVGGRYKFLGADGAMKGDIEVDLGWENWGKRCKDNADFVDGCTSPGQYRVVVDSAAYVEVGGTKEIAIHLKDNFVEHRFKDTWNVRLGGSYVLPAGGSNTMILRGGVGYDTQAAEKNWLRTDIDGAARITTTAGASYRTKRWQATLGIGAILEGENTNGNDCNPEKTGANPDPGCGPGGVQRPVEDREGPDPISPIVVPESQSESPVNKGTITSNYLLFMLGFTTWF